MKRTKPDCQRLCSKAVLWCLFLWHQFWKLRLFGGWGSHPWQTHNTYSWHSDLRKVTIKIPFLCVPACWLSSLRAEISSWAINLNSQTTLHFTATYKETCVPFMLFYFMLLIGWVSWGEMMEVYDGQGLTSRKWWRLWHGRTPLLWLSPKVCLRV